MMVAATGPKWATEPFIMGTPEQFARLREWLVGVGFTEAGMGAATGVDTLYAMPSLAEGRPVFREPVDALSLLVHLFLDGIRVSWEIVNAILSQSDRAILDALGLLQPSVTNPALCVATVALYPIDGVYFVSDRHGGLEITGSGSPSDLVFSALTPLTHEFVALMPRIHCSDYLELCSGTGIAALLAADSFAEHAWAVDITERSTHFATFNALLNGLSNTTILQGDLYEPVLGRSFDLITAHPPYVPSFDNEMVFRDGGEDGEQITRAIIAGLPQYLRPGGRFFCDCMMTDRKGAPVEARIREMLGPAEAEFDVVVAQSSAADPVARFADAVRDGRSTPEMFARRLAAFERMEVESFVALVVVIQRRQTMRKVGTRRRIFTSATTSADLQWLVSYVAGTADWSADDSNLLLSATVRCLPSTELRTRSVVKDGKWAVVGSQLATVAPFAIEASCPLWFSSFLAWCDGTITVRSLFKRLQESGLIGEEGDENDFARLVHQLADAPFIELSTFPMPAVAGSTVTDR